MMDNFEDTFIRRFPAAHAFNGAARYIRFEPQERPIQPVDFFARIRTYIDEALARLVEGCDECRVQAVLGVRILQYDPITGENTASQIMYAAAPVDIASNPSFFDSAIGFIMQDIEVFIQNGSNWIVESVQSFDLRVVKYFSAPNKRGHSFVDLPPRLKAKKAVINVDNASEHNCFMFAILSRVHLLGSMPFSIAAFWYKRALSQNFQTTEASVLNGDAQVNIIDFSIMAFYWTG